MNPTLPALALLALAACAPTLTPLPRPAGGYEAIRFREPVSVNVGLVNLDIPAGTVFVRDRALPDGTPLWCQGVGDLQCITVEPGRIRVQAHVANIAGRDWSHPVGPHMLERFRL